MPAGGQAARVDYEWNVIMTRADERVPTHGRGGRRFGWSEVTVVSLVFALAGAAAGSVLPLRGGEAAPAAQTAPAAETAPVATAAPATQETPAQEERAPLAARFGPGRHSQWEEEWIVRDFFDDRRDGFFVDVGANHHERWSNTYYLEKELGWSGIAVEPQKEFAEGYRQHRPRTVFVPFFVSDASNQQAKLYVQRDNLWVTSAHRDFNERWGSDITELEAPTITLDDLLAAQKVKRFDFLSLDVELWEPKVLAGFSIEKFRPALVCVEGHQEVRQQLLDYFARHGYVLVGRYLRADEHNLWFKPREGR